MPKVVKYKANSVVYFASDFADRVYILKEGKIVLNYKDIETGEQITEKIKQGELFGVKAVIGNYPREETAVVLSDSEAYSFSADEFERFAVKNPRIILQMIKIFSKQLRKIHTQINSVIRQESEAENVELSNDDGLFSVAEAFFNSENYSICIAVCKRYLALFRRGKHREKAEQLIQNCQAALNGDFGSIKSLPQNPFDTPTGLSDEELADIERVLIDATRDEEAGKFSQAYQKYSKLVDCGDEEFSEFAILGIARCLIGLEKFDETIKFLSATIKQNPKSQRISTMLSYLGQVYEKTGAVAQSKAFFEKARDISSLNLPEKIDTGFLPYASKNGTVNRFAKRFKKGELIFSEFEPGDVFYLIQSGQVQLIKIINGFEKNLDILQPHEIFGEMAILDNSPRSASAIAYDDVAVLEFNKENFEQLMNGNPEISLVLLRTFIKRIYEQKRRFMILTIQDKQARLADVFLMLDETMTNIDRSSEMRIFDINLEGVARWAGMTISEVEENIRKFLDQGRIEVFSDRIVVQNMAQLHRFVQARTPQRD